MILEIAIGVAVTSWATVGVIHLWMVPLRRKKLRLEVEKAERERARNSDDSVRTNDRR